MDAVTDPFSLVVVSLEKPKGAVAGAAPFAFTRTYELVNTMREPERPTNQPTNQLAS